MVPGFEKNVENGDFPQVWKKIVVLSKNGGKCGKMVGRISHFFTFLMVLVLEVKMMGKKKKETIPSDLPFSKPSI